MMSIRSNRLQPEAIVFILLFLRGFSDGRSLVRSRAESAKGWWCERISTIELVFQGAVAPLSGCHLPATD
ncbi:hypothetical protein, partial [Aeromonas hydrophila]|uniref:hypothetical protein n=1 Tax=Aeromonas hydrophila TaxID=644 RepID=UPI003F66A348